MGMPKDPKDFPFDNKERNSGASESRASRNNLSESGQRTGELKSIQRTRIKRTEADELHQQRLENPYEGQTEEDRWDSARVKDQGSGKRIAAFLMLLAVAAIVALIMVRNKKKGAADPSLQAQPTIAENGKSESERNKESEEEVIKLEKALKGYIEAENPEELKKYVRSADRVSSLIDKYYAIENYTPSKYESLGGFSNERVEERPCAIAFVRTDKGGKKVLLTKNKEGDYLVDWETDVGYQSMMWEVFLKQQPKESLEMRVVVAPDSFYVGEFLDEDKYASFRISQSKNHEHVFGYVERNSLLYRKIFSRFNDRLTRIGDFSEMILRLRWVEGGEKFKQVLIEELVAESWVYIKD